MNRDVKRDLHFPPPPRTILMKSPGSQWRTIRQRLAMALLGLVLTATAQAQPEPPGVRPLIGYTEFRTNLPGGRHANVATMRAMLVGLDGSGRRPVAKDLSREPDTWTQFAGWSPDGRLAIVGRGWESSENARWEEEHRQFRFTAEGWLYDMLLVDLAAGSAVNLTAVDRVSFHNTGLFFWPGDPSRLGFQAMIDGNSHPFRMDRDGRHKRDLTLGSREFAYGFVASRDGRRIAYHRSYQVYVADADGSNARRIDTGQPFNFGPQWSAEGKHLLFLAGEHENCHPYVANADGTGLRRLADRGGYRGVIAFLDVPDFHSGSSDVPAWSADGRAVYYTAKVGPSVELFRAALDGRPEQLTHSPDGTLHYHPTPSPDGRYLGFGTQRQGVRQLGVLRIADRARHSLTNLERGHAAMWPHWQPSAAD
ncbi:MAG: TolB family protein [Isosphaeraceae bacterium]